MLKSAFMYPGTFRALNLNVLFDVQETPIDFVNADKDINKI